MLLAGPCLAQGGQGAMAGGNGGAVDKEVLVQQHILSPNDAAFWPIDAREGETIIVMIESKAFDPIVQVASSEGRVLAENDDIRPGDQRALLTFRFPVAGAYRVLIRAAKEGANGLYTIRMRRFTPRNLPFDQRVAAGARQEDTWYRFPAEKGQALVVTATSTGGLPRIALFGPTGEELTAKGDALSAKTARIHYMAEESGTYYLRVPGESLRENYTLNLSLARIMDTAVGKAEPATTLPPGGLDIWRFQAREGEIITVLARSRDVVLGVEVSPDEGSSEQGREAERDGFNTLEGDEKAHNEKTMVFLRSGIYRVSVSRPLAPATEYTIEVRPGATAWQVDRPTSGKLAIGKSDYWTMDVRQGQIMQIEGLSENFDLELAIYDGKGRFWDADYDSGPGKSAILATVFPASGRYLVRVHSYGNGGGGNYRLRNVDDAIQRTAIGRKETGSVGNSGRALWTIQGKAGQRVLIVGRSADFVPGVRVTGPDGLNLGEGVTQGDGLDDILSLRLPLDGTYTIWMFAKDGGGRYTLQTFAAD
jgi:hypothetical protein